MKLFWSLRAVKRLPDTEATFVPPDGPVGVDVGMIVGGRRVASARLIRSGVAPDLVGTTATLARQGFVGTYAARPNRPPAPAVLIVGGSLPGYSPVYAEHLASHGYPSLAIAYWGAPGLPPELKEIPLEYFQRALAWLASQPGVDPHRIAVLGISYGVGAAILSAAHYPSLVAGVVGCTGGFEIPALPPSDGSAWTLAGAPIPPGALPVEEVTGPVLFFGGGKDEIDQTALAARRLVERARSFGHTNVTARIYRLAGHGAGCRFPNQPLSTFLQVRPHTYAEIGGTAEANEEAAADGWPRILRFLASLP